MGHLILKTLSPVKTKLIIFLTLVTVFLFIPSLSAQEKATAHWAQEDLLELAAQGVLSPGSDPEQFVTRAQFTAMLIRALALEDEAVELKSFSSPFLDVADNHPLKGFILAAKERGLISGYSSDIFKPEEELSREQMVVLFLRTMGLGELQVDKKILKFKDKEKISDYARASVSEGVRLGLVQGYADNTFRPQEKVTLAQAAAFINRWLELKGDRYDYIGTLEQIDRKNNTLILRINKNLLTLPLAEEMQVLTQGQPATFSEIEPGALLAVNINLKGQVVLIHQKEVSTTDLSVNFGSITATKEDSPTHTQDNNKVKANNLFNPKLPLNPKDISLSFQTNQAEINLPLLRQILHTTGSGQVVAVIDTGVDPAHPDLRFTTKGEPKIIDYVDFTLEGVINTVPVSPTENKIIYQGGEYFLGDIPSQSGTYRFALFDVEEVLPLELMGLETKTKKVALLLTDSSKAGVYDTVYVDVNGDENFAGEKALKIYRQNQDYFVLTYAGKELAYTIADIDSQGRYVQLAGDLSGHGTHVAGIIGANGELKGVAPGAQLMVLKAVDRNGYADPANIIEAIRYAAIHGADIINISLGLYDNIEPGRSSLSQIVNQVVEEYGVTVVVAAGNIGPGINTVAAPADADKAISVGAFVSPKMWEVDFGHQVPQDSLYYFSSVGPRPDGAWYPSLVAPGSAVSTVPGWMPNPYMLTEGTSMAAPHVTGVVAHLLEGAQKIGLKTTPSLIKRALEEGARDLENFTINEDGHGVVDAYKAWQKLKEIPEERKLNVRLFNPKYGSAPGFFTRELVPERLILELTNNHKQSFALEWFATVPWIQPELKTTYIANGSTREIPLRFHLPQEAGLYSGVLRGDDPKVPGLEVEIPVNIIIGENIHTKKPYTYSVLDSLDPAQLKRYFFQVPSGTSLFGASLEIFPDTAGNYQGRGRLHLVDSSGVEKQMSEYAGAGTTALKSKNKVRVVEYVPEPGTWEVVVYSSAALKEFGLDKTKYQLTVELGEIANKETGSSSNLNIVLSPVPAKALEKASGPITLHLWDLDENKPFEGVLLIDSRLYQIQNGRLDYEFHNGSG